MSLFVGSGVAVVTPIKEDGSVNFDAYEKLIDFLIENDSDAIVSCGTTGEASTLTDEEQLEAIRCAVKTANKRVPVIAGAGSNYTDHGIELCKGAEKMGADGCLLVTPYYNKTTQKGLVKHFEAQAKSIDIPVILYNVPGRTGINIAPKTVYELSKIDNIIGIKEASGDLAQMSGIAELCGKDFDLYSGNDDQIVPIMSLGGKGVISVLANIAPKQTHDIVMKFLEGDVSASLEMQLKALPLVRALFSVVNPIPVKEALNIMGKNVGGFRLPLVNMEESNLEILKKEMMAYGLI